MKRLLIAMTATQEQWLKDQAKKFGITVTEVIRRMIDKARGEL